MYSIPIDSGIYYLPQSIPQQQSDDAIQEIEKLLEGKIINGQRRTNRYGSKAFGSFGPFERNPLPPTFQTVLDHILESHRPQLEAVAAEDSKDSKAQLSWNQVEIIKLSAGSKYFFDIDQEQETAGPLLFINLSGAHPITLYNHAPATPITTTLADPLPAGGSGATPEPMVPFLSPSVIISPAENACLALSESATKRYSKQIKASSYRTKAIPVDLVPFHPTTSPTATTPATNIPTNALVYDYSLLLRVAKQKHREKKAKRLEWLQTQQADGKLTPEQVAEIKRKDFVKDAQDEAELADQGEELFNGQTDQTSTSQHESNPARDYLLSLPTTPYRRANSYALVFRSFVKYTPLLDSSLQEQQTGDVNGTPSASLGSVSEQHRKQYIEKQQRSNKTVPGLAINLEDMTEEQLAEFEKNHVHSVYDNIADHFSGTRYQAWPQVDEFVQGLPAGTLMADIGCGNGKYLNVNPNITTLGCDISINLLKLAHQRGCNVAVGDSLAVPFRSNSFDNTISIAVLHHVASRKRRIEAINEMLRITRPGGQVLITVWAKEQDGSGGRVFTQGDVWVPFKTTAGAGAEIEKQKEKRAKELEEHRKSNRKEIVVQSVVEQSEKQPQDEKQPETATETTTTHTTPTIDSKLPEDVNAESTRFYHVFCQGEIEDHANDPAIALPNEN